MSILDILFGTRKGAGAANDVWAWGEGPFGELGTGNTVSRSSPVSVVGDFTDWVQISAGNRFSAGVRSNGTAWTWGKNDVGQLGDGTTNNTSSPVSVIGGFTDWVEVSAGSSHCIGRRGNGTIWTWGNGANGRLGDNSTVNKSSPVSVVGGFTDWLQVSAGGNFSLGVRSTAGIAMAWGDNLHGQLGTGNTISRSSPVVCGQGYFWSQVSAGQIHSLGLGSTGAAWAWGNNGQGRLGDGTTTIRSSPVPVVGGYTWSLVSAGAVHSLGLKSDGTAWAWGEGGGGQLGTNSTTDRSSPVSVVGGFTNWTQLTTGPESGHNLGINSSGIAWAWGEGAQGKLGDNSTTNRSSPVPVVGGYQWTQLSAGYNQSLGIRQ